MAWATRLATNYPKLTMTVFGQHRVAHVGGPQPQFWGSNDGTKEVKKLRNLFFPISLPQIQGSRDTLSNKNMSREKNEGFYIEVARAGGGVGWGETQNTSY